jgi:hypothetical protein
MEKWESQSHPGKQIAVAIVCVGLGLTLAVGFYNFNGPGMRTPCLSLGGCLNRYQIADESGSR